MGIGGRRVGGRVVAVTGGDITAASGHLSHVRLNSAGEEGIETDLVDQLSVAFHNIQVAVIRGGDVFGRVEGGLRTVGTGGETAQEDLGGPLTWIDLVDHVGVQDVEVAGRLVDRESSRPFELDIVEGDGREGAARRTIGRGLATQGTDETGGVDHPYTTTIGN